jgi:nicotinamidase-related amidase
MGRFIVTNVSRETTGLLSREDCILVVIDVQEKLMPAISNQEKVVENVVRLVKFSNIIGLPIVVTEQEKLGATLPEVAKELGDFRPIDKVCFNCFFCQNFADEVTRLGRKTLIVTGAEAHICVAQTAIFAASRFRVQAVSDAISSRTRENWRVSLERMQEEGVSITSTEMFIYEILQKAGTDEFKAALKLVK